MRFLAMALLALVAVLSAGVPAEARSRTQQAQAQTRTAAPQTARAATARRTDVPQRHARAAQPTRQAAAQRGSRQSAARTGGTQQAAAACTRGARCRPRAVAWQQGLAPATNMQAQSCPVGTMATLARGHTDVVRCLPL